MNVECTRSFERANSPESAKPVERAITPESTTLEERAMISTEQLEVTDKTGGAPCSAGVNGPTDEGGSAALTPPERALISAYQRGNSRRRVKWAPMTLVGMPMKWGFYDPAKRHFHVVLFDYDRDRFHERVDAAMGVVG